MQNMIVVETDKFSVLDERGSFVGAKYLIHWLAEEMESNRYRVNQLKFEDDGWYLYFEVNGCVHYFYSLVQPIDSESTYEWMLQISNKPSLIERISGKFNLNENAGFLQELIVLLNGSAKFSKVLVNPYT